MSLHHLFASCGVGVEIDPSVQIDHPERMYVGDRVRIMRAVTFYGKQTQVRLGDDVILYPNTFVQGDGSLNVEDRVAFFPNTYISLGRPDGFVKVGRDSHFAVGCALYGSGGLSIGPECAFAAHTVITTVAHDHRIVDRPIVKTGRRAPITIAGNVWTGANATILPGVTVAEGCVIGAGAVLTKDTTPYGVYLGVPARLAYLRREQHTAWGFLPSH